MKVHEYQAKELLKKAGVAVPDGIVATTPAEAAKAYDALGGGLIVVKAQVHAGGRGKGVAVGPDDDRALALEIASGQQAAARFDGQGGATGQVGRGSRKSRRQPAGQDTGHLPDRCRRGARSPRCWSRSGTTSPASSTWGWRSTAACNARS